MRHPQLKIHEKYDDTRTKIIIIKSGFKALAHLLMLYGDEDDSQVCIGVMEIFGRVKKNYEIEKKKSIVFSFYFSWKTKKKNK